jgi:hypothetical protein
VRIKPTQIHSPHLKPLFVLQRSEIPLFAAGHKTFRHTFEFLPPRPDCFGFFGGDFVIARRHRNDRQQVSELWTISFVAGIR